MRTKGSSSYRRVEMWRLQRLFNGDMVVPVSRKWLEAMGVSMDEDAPAPVMPEITARPENKRVEIDYEVF